MHTVAAYFQMDNVCSRQFLLRIYDMRTEEICFLLLSAVLDLNTIGVASLRGYCSIWQSQKKRPEARQPGCCHPQRGRPGTYRPGEKALHPGVAGERETGVRGAESPRLARTAEEATKAG